MHLKVLVIIQEGVLRCEVAADDGMPEPFLLPPRWLNPGVITT